MLNALALARIATGYEETPDYKAILPRLRDDYERWQFCIAMAEHYRSAWHLQSRAHQRRIVESREKRYANLSAEDCKTVGAIKWAKSVVGRDMDDMEKRFLRWANAYAMALQAQRGARSVPQSRVPSSPLRVPSL